MKALVYEGPGHKSLVERPMPVIAAATDAIVKVTRTTICGTDLHILKGDVPTCTPGRILGHEGVGIVQDTGAGVTRFAKGDRVLISCISSCGKCEYCRRGMYSHCTTGGWILGNTIDGTQAEYVRIPHADTSLYPIPHGADEEALVMLSDILPTGFECGVLNGKVQPGGSVAIVGAGPIGLAALLTAQFYSPADIIMVDLDENRLAVAKRFGATHTIQASGDSAARQILVLTGGKVSTPPSRRSASPSPSSFARPSSRPAVSSPISAFTARKLTCTSKGCGRRTLPSPPDWWTRLRRRCS